MTVVTVGWVTCRLNSFIKVRQRTELISRETPECDLRSDRRNDETL